MRRVILIALFLVVAGFVALVLLRQSNRATPVAAEPEAARPGHAVPEHTLQSEPDWQRAVLAPPADSAAQLVVHVRGQFRHAAVAGAKVSVESDSYVPDYSSSKLDIPELLGEGRTDSAGDLTLAIRANEPLRVGAQSPKGLPPPEFVYLRGGLTVGARAEVEILVPEEDDARIVGRVVCAETREPVAGAHVRVLTGGQTRDERRSPDPHGATTGNDGVFELPFLLASDPRLCVEAQGYGLRYASLDAVHADLAHALVMYVSRSATLSARVLDAAGAPITGARIELTVKGNRLAHHDADEAGFYSSGITYSFPPDEHWRAVTGADGRAQLEGLAPRVEIQAEVVKDEKLLRREPDGLTFEPGEKREVEWLIGAGTELRGLVLDQDGKPVEKLEVWAVTAGPGGRRYLMSYESGHVGAKASTGPEGRFVLHDLAAGRWSIGPSGENESLVAPIAELVELAGEPVFDLTLRVSRAIYIRGRVLAPSGEGAPNCWVNGFLTPADRPEGVPTGSDGSFAYGPLGPGTYTLTADAIGRFASSDPVQANAGDKDVVLQLQQGGSIRGRVVDGVTGAATSAQLVFAPEQVISGILVEGMQMTTEPNGSFSVGGLVPGRWSVTASTADGRFAQHAHIEVGAGTDSGELVCALSPGGKLRLGYQGAQPWVHVTVKCQGAAVLLLAGVEAGKFTEYMAPAGALVLEIRGKSAGTVRTKQVELKPGETREIVLTDDD